MIIRNIHKYDGSLIHTRFAYKFFREKTLPIGNIIAFRGEMDVTTNLIDSEDLLNNDYIHSADAINFCWEIPHLCPLGAVTFQRYFNTFIGDILGTKYLNKQIRVDGDDLMVQDKFSGSDGSEQVEGKCSVSITYSKDNVAIGHTGININAGEKAPNFAYSTKLTDEQTDQFMKDVIDIFYFILDDMHIATSKVIV